MDVRFLRTYCSLVLGYASLAFAMDAFPSLTAMAVEASWQAGGVKEMAPSIMDAPMFVKSDFGFTFSTFLASAS